MEDATATPAPETTTTEPTTQPEPPVPTTEPTAPEQAKSPNEEAREIVSELRRIANAIPTPNVTDSHAHGRALDELAARLERLVEDA
jgi:hypothetical protein